MLVGPRLVQIESNVDGVVCHRIGDEQDLSSCHWPATICYRRRHRAARKRQFYAKPMSLRPGMSR